MKFLENLVEKLEPQFSKGGKYEKWYPVFDGFATFLFVPKHTTHSGVHVRDAVDLKRTMNTVIQALIPCLLFGIWNAGYQHYRVAGVDATFLETILFGLGKVLPLVIVSYVAGLATEFAFCVIKKHTINEGFLVSGMLIPLCLPVDVPLWMVAIATIFAVVFGKEVFGGTGMNLLNPALTARAFLFFAYPTWMSGDKVWISGLADGSVKADASAGVTQLGKWASTIDVKSDPVAVSKIMNSTYSTSELFLGNIPGSVGETSVLAILIGAGLLLHTGVGSWKIMLSGLIGALVMASVFNVAGANPFMSVSPIDQILAGGFMFGLVFMATDPVSASQTEVGKLIYGFFVGFFSIMIRVFNPAYPEGVMLAILFMNVMAPLIDHYVVQGNIKERLKRAKLHSSHL
jgi:Na+-transporting NADH:ubiquinone oxidoreductase subunit B